MLTATTQTIAWMVVFFFASAGASAAYLTVSEILPMETRALAIAFFYSVGTGLGGIIGPVLFGNLIATKRPADTAIGYLIGAALMVAAGLVEAVIGVEAEQKSLEDLARPLSEADGDGGADSEGRDYPQVSGIGRVAGPNAPPRARLVRSGWAPLPQASDFPLDNPFLPTEVDSVVGALHRRGPLTSSQLAVEVRSRLWGPGRLRSAIRSGLASGRIRGLKKDLYVAAGERSMSDP